MISKFGKLIKYLHITGINTVRSGYILEGLRSELPVDISQDIIFHILRLKQYINDVTPYLFIFFVISPY